MALARIQCDAVDRGTVAPLLGVRAGRARRPIRLDVLTARAAATRLQPRHRMPRAHAGRAAEAFVGELSQPCQGLRRPDDAASYECRSHASADARRWPGEPCACSSY